MGEWAGGGPGGGGAGGEGGGLTHCYMAFDDGESADLANSTFDLQRGEGPLDPSAKVRCCVSGDTGCTSLSNFERANWQTQLSS